MERVSLWQELVADNPAIKEAHRLPWQRMNPKTWSTGTSISVAILFLAYGSLTALALQGVQFIDPSLFMFVCLFACIFAPAVVLYGSIAGEREKRTLDLLLVAPLTARQILVAKVIRIAFTVIAIIVLLVIPMVVFAIVRTNLALSPMSSKAPFSVALVTTVALSLSGALFVTGVAMWVSSLNKTTAGALTGILAVLFLVYVVYAVVAGVMGVINRDLSELMMLAHPFAVLAWTCFPSPEVANPLLGTFFSAFVHSVVGLALLWLATRELDRNRSQEKTFHA